MARDTLVLESFPLHTEKPEWAAHAPAQVTAACRRGAHVIGLTEFRQKVPEMTAVAHQHGYTVYGSHKDAHRQVAILTKRGIKVTNHDDVVVSNNHRVGVQFDFFGSQVTVFETHWETYDNERELKITHSLIEAMTKASEGSGLGFYMGDTNPTKPQRVKGSEPSTTLRKAGMPSIWQELDEFPAHMGVNIIGRNKADTRVKAKSAKLFPPLGSDHYPMVATYSIKRVG